MKASVTQCAKPRSPGKSQRVLVTNAMHVRIGIAGNPRQIPRLCKFRLRVQVRLRIRQRQRNCRISANPSFRLTTECDSA
jgi:hypothetical protein